MDFPGRMLFDIGVNDQLCPCCKKRFCIEHGTKCLKCGGDAQLPICSNCNMHRVERMHHKWCAACRAKGSGKQDGISPQWHAKIGNVMSGLRQRTRFNGHGSCATFREVATLLKIQNFRCAISGEQLKPDRSTQLGHKKPISEGGTSTIDNLFWITKEVNRMMGTMSADAFIELCRKVAATASA